MYGTDDTLPGAISLVNFLTAAMSRLAIRQKLEADFDRRVRFMSVALSEHKGVVPTMAKLRIKELPLTKGTLFAGEWTSTVESSGHLGPIRPRNVVQGLQDRVHGKTSDYVEGMVDRDPQNKNPARRADLERGLQSMLDKHAIREIPMSPETPGFYSPIFLVAKESGRWRPILNVKAFNKFVVPPSFWMETLRTVMDCLGRQLNK